MFNFTAILTDLQAAIAVGAARHRALTPLLVAVWGRISRMSVRLERLVALWRAGKLPKAGAPRAPRARAADQPVRRLGRAGMTYPPSRAWLTVRVWEATAFRGQLEHLLSREDCVAFLAAVPQAGRILRPLCHMLGVDPVPAAIRKPKTPVVGHGLVAAPVVQTVSVVPVPVQVIQISGR